MQGVNSALRTARENVASAAHLGEHLSRQELADLVNAYLWDRHGKRVEIDAHYVAKLERGVIRWPNSHYREAFRAVLGASDDAELGFRTARREAAPARRAQVSDWDVRQISAAARTFAAEQHRHGGWWLREAALAQMRWATGLLTGSADQSLRSAVGHLAYVCGFMCFDTSAPAEALRLFNLALRCGEGDWPFRAAVLSAMSRQATWIGRPDDGLTLAEQALVRADRLSATQRAMLHVARARSLGALGRTQESIREVGRSDEEFARAEPGLEPPAMSFYDQRQHLGDSGEALTWAALRGHHADEACRRLQIGVDRSTEATARSKLLAQVKLAALTMAVGDPAEAVLLGTAAVRGAGAVRSDRVTVAFDRLAHQARKHRDVRAVSELLAQLPTPSLQSRPVTP